MTPITYRAGLRPTKKANNIYHKTPQTISSGLLKHSLMLNDQIDERRNVCEPITYMFQTLEKCLIRETSNARNSG